MAAGPGPSAELHATKISQAQWMLNCIGAPYRTESVKHPAPWPAGKGAWGRKGPLEGSPEPQRRWPTGFSQLLKPTAVSVAGHR